MEIIIGKHFEFDACHKLPDASIYGICSKMHGHRYELDVEVKGKVTEQGWVCDFKELKALITEHIINVYDHSNLNDFFEIPTVENIAIHIFNKINDILKNNNYKLNKIKMHETSNSYVVLTA